jgi:UDP:flavonoid glycosyltransferase YjiC (YdhE family)
MILVPTPSHTEQFRNAKQAENLKAAKIIQQEELSREKLLESIQQILKERLNERLLEIQEEILKHDGLENAVKTIIAAAENKGFL